ncbi:MAG: DUF1553 domain-containing protein [Planctomycetota bacterium]|nr:DUF1553 domain-containing protein [Planctomycetota bacterium]
MICCDSKFRFVIFSGWVSLALLIQASGWGQQELSFSQHIAPILTENCYQCHGPDDSNREADFRLDQKSSAFSKRGSGQYGIDLQNPLKSEILTRMLAKDDLQMPPENSGYSISPSQIKIIQTWIEQGAPWDNHWAFEPIQITPLPSVKNQSWPHNPIDQFILSKLEANGLQPAKRANFNTLWRRLKTDMVGLFPGQLDQPFGDKIDQRYEAQIDRLLASPGFGEKWSRHWLDVARYADSNGADENHYYPNAYHYRDWVIHSFNEDLPFDQFITHQLAGDLIATQDNPAPLAGTGFLAIGIKILAEKDPEKKRMDMIDEQLDTLGQTFLGLTLGCARCHDHKFDPIPTRDYYALAGILHSTEVTDRELFSPEQAQQKKAIEATIAETKRQILVKQSEIDNGIKKASFLSRQAEAFDRGNVAVDKSTYGKGIGIISDPGSQENFSEYDFSVPEKTTYMLQLRYAAKNARPGRILVNKKLVLENAISKTTGSWTPETQTWFNEGKVTFSAGKNTLRIESKPLMSHIDQFRLIDLSREKEVASWIEQIDELENQIQLAQAKIPVPQKIMSVKDGTHQDISIHLRGSHLSLGEKVRRGFVSRLQGGPKPHIISGKSSGRIELARWLTDEDSIASQVVARVIVNRIWHWYFGQGLVNSPNEFGIRGDHPSHGELLDFLALQLIENNWSLKSIHRDILLSQTYQMSSTADSERSSQIDPDNRLLAFHPIKRLSPEVYRDLILQLRGDLDSKIGGPSPQVTSQDPSPDKLDENQHVYDSSKRRSVYLPVIRSNTYDLFTNFDFPDPSATVGKRNETIVPTQSLLLMNGEFVQESSKRIFQRVNKNHLAAAKAFSLGLGKKPKFLIRNIFELLLGRAPTDQELAKLNDFVGRSPEDLDYILLIHTLLMSNDFLFIR